MPAVFFGFPQAEQDLHGSGRPEEESVHAEAPQLLATEAAVAQWDAAHTATSLPSAGAQDGRAGELPLSLKSNLYLFFSATLFQKIGAKAVSLGNCPFVMSHRALIAHPGEHSQPGVDSRHLVYALFQKCEKYNKVSVLA